MISTRKNNQKAKIVLVGGGTFGHISPLLSVANLIKKKYNYNIISDYRGKKYIKDTKNVRYVFALGFGGKNIFIKSLSILILVLQIVNFIFRFSFNRPDLVIVFGGYLSLAPSLACWLLRIKFMIHEQNSVLGIANKALLPFSNKIAISFENTKELNLKYKNKIIYSGNPSRFDNGKKSRNKAIKLSNKNEINILITGGSQGSGIFSKLVTQAIVKLPQSVRNKCKIWQQCREEDIASTEKIYNQARINYEIKSFFKNIEELILMAKILITRSGASTLSEIAYFAKPSILIPLPNSVKNHQFINAQYFASRKAAIYFSQKSDSKKLSTLIKNTISNSDNLTELSSQAKKLYNQDALNIFSNNINALVNS